MTLDEILNLIRAQGHKDLTRVREMILRQAWEGQTYSSMARESHYESDYLKKTAAELWHLLSDLFGEPITKTNFRSALEPCRLTPQQQKLIEGFSHKQTSAIKWDSDALEFPSGPVPLSSFFYIKRSPIEESAYQEVCKPGSAIRIKGPRKIGKSSLLARIIAHATAQGYQTVYIDFQQLDDRSLANLDKFLRCLCANISQQLELESRLADYWDEEIGGKVSCTLYLKRYLLEQIHSPLVLALNEVDRIFQYPAIAREFLLLLRSWHEEAKQVEILKKLRLVLVQSTEVYSPLNIEYFPFDVGLPITLPPFTLEQLQDLAICHGLNWTNGDQAQQLMTMVGGHPYLVRLVLYQLCQMRVTLEQLIQDAPTITGIFKDHLQSYLMLLQAKPELAAAFKQVVTTDKSVQLDPMLAYALDNMGLVKIDADGVKPSCELYRLYFDSQLLGREGFSNTHKEISDSKLIPHKAQATQTQIPAVQSQLQEAQNRIRAAQSQLQEAQSQLQEAQSQLQANNG